MMISQDDLRRQLTPPRLMTLFLQTSVGPDVLVQVSFSSPDPHQEDIDMLIKNLVLAREVLLPREQEVDDGEA